MALSNSILAYNDCREFLERAVEDPKGARLPFGSSRNAEYWRMRCNQFRSLDREQNKRIYEPGHKMWGVSEYDTLTLTIRYSADNLCWVYAVKLILDAGMIEPLSEVPGFGEPLEVTAEEVKFLVDHSNDDEEAEQS